MIEYKYRCVCGEVRCFEMDGWFTSSRVVVMIERERETASRERETAQREREKQQVERERETASRERETAKRERNSQEREKQPVEREKQPVEREKQQVETKICKDALSESQYILKLPLFFLSRHCVFLFLPPNSSSILLAIFLLLLLSYQYASSFSHPPHFITIITIKSHHTALQQ